MTAWQALGAVVLAGILAVGGWRLWWVSRSLDRHVDSALRLGNARTCQCGGALREVSGVWHDGVLCQPLRESIDRGVS